MTDAKSSDESINSGIAETVVAPSAAPSGSSISGTLGVQRLAGRYEILSLLGTGGMGTVYRARDVELDEVVALKVLRRELVDSPDMLARFRQEAKLARRVTHRNVARTFDIGEHAGEKFLTMEFVDGESLASLAERRRRLPLPEVVHIVKEVCAGMSAAHAANVVHRDLKPDNVLVGVDGRVVVTDFGIAHAAAGAVGVEKTLGGVVGTPAYMAPEQVEGGADVDARADIYALGAMIYELLTGDRAWPGDTPFVVAAARLVHPPPDPRVQLPTLSTAVAAVVMRCMARSRADRFSGADEVAAAFAEAASFTATASTALAATSLAPSAPAAEASAPIPHAGSDKTIAVLPFTNRGAPEDEYLADGLTEDLIDVLSMTRGLKVRPRGAVAHLRGNDVDPRRVGGELGVQVVVDGSVRKSDARIRVTARLVSTSDGFQLWAKRFDRPVADALAVNDEAAHAIAEALTVASPAKPRVALADPIAVDLYLRATHEYHKFWREDAARAVGLYEQALARAPNDPTILAACARARVRVAFFGGEGAAEMLTLAREAAERAVLGAPEMGESWVALASTRVMGGDAPGAVSALVTALEKAERLGAAHDLLGRILAEAGRPEDAITHLQMALSIDPSAVAARIDLVRVYALLGRWDQADALMALEAPTASLRISKFLSRMRLCMWRGETHPELENPPDLGEMGAFIKPGEIVTLLKTRELSDAYRETIEAAAHVGDKGSRRRTLFFQLNAEVYAYVFEIDQALSAIEDSIQSGLIDLLWMDRCPVFEPVRRDARFAPLRARVHERATQVVTALAKR